MAKQTPPTETSFTVASSGEDLRFAARIGDFHDALHILERYKNSNNPLSNLLPAVLATGDSLSGNKALHLCSANGHVDMVRLLLDHGADVNATNMSGSTALHYASLNGRLEVVQELVKYKARAVVENKFAKTALDEARAGRKDLVAKFLLDHVEKTGVAPDLATAGSQDSSCGVTGDSKN
eukprot:GFKZ01009656.1.p2 GENE.GFKZ01009656.1~~GFKZ01009656.1.p2  ORF type:complete len:180 (+),score=26.58 GFKZ01009656.1:89-628(+)